MSDIVIGPNDTIQSLEMAMVTRAEFDKWTKDSATLDQIKKVRKHMMEAQGGTEVANCMREIIVIIDNG